MKINIIRITTKSYIINLHHDYHSIKPQAVALQSISNPPSKSHSILIFETSTSFSSPSFGIRF
jgi:hypothetical protein